MRKETKGYLYVTLGATCLGTIGIFARLIYQHEPDPLTVVSWRALIAFFLLFFIAVLVNPDWLRIRKKDFPFFAVYGLLSVSLCFLLFFYAIKHTTVATATILLYTYPAFVVLLSPLTLGETFTRAKILALLLTFLGCILVIQVYDPAQFKLNWKGISYGLGAGLGAGLYSIFGKRGVRKYSPYTVVMYALGFGGFFLLLIKGTRNLISVSYPPVTWLWILSLAVVSTLLGYSLYTRGLKYLEAGRAGIACTWEVVVASILAFMIFGETLSALQIAGACLVFAGIVLVRIHPPDRAGRAAVAPRG
ncbi:MAG: EamA family transporter [Candidatus Zixiibacteriota bacterium]|nr:MAG: EamA family transporter [candidate division Zixibacteria bacterium]